MDLIKAEKELMFGKTIYDMNSKIAIYFRVGSDNDEKDSDTQENKREEFLRMMEDTRFGEKDLIFTKKVSEFAYSTVDSIKYAKSLLKPINNYKSLVKEKFSNKRIGNKNKSNYYKSKNIRKIRGRNTKWI